MYNPRATTVHVAVGAIQGVVQQAGTTTDRGFRQQKFARFLLLFVFFSAGHFPSKGSLVCLDIILTKRRFEGQKICVENYKECMVLG
jgi:hypothetical protein